MATTAGSGRRLAGLGVRAIGLAGHTVGSVVPRRGMPLRKRISLAAAAAVAMAVALAVVVCYGAVRLRLQSELDAQLQSQAQYTDSYLQEHANAYGMTFPSFPASQGGSAPYGQFVTAASTILNTLPRNAALPQVSTAAAVADGEHGAYFSDASVNGTDVRLYTFRLPGLEADGEGVALQLGRPLSQINSVLHELRVILLVLFLFAVPLAAIFGRFAARRVLRPLAEVTATVEAIAETDDLSRRIEVREEDEVGQLASRFNAMLERLTASREKLDESVRSQRQLVADASHELRTPVTSLRTNVEVLLASPDLDEGDRALLNDVLEQSEELSTLVADLIEVARGELPSESLEDIRLDLLVEEALIRARRNAPTIPYEATLTPVMVTGSAERLSRAVNNLLDNAAKHAGGGTIEVRVDFDGFTVRDHGAGIDPADLPYIFDRFYRGVNSRSTQGSGLGLAIVRQTAELHGGSVRAANAPGGGAIFTLELPVSAPGRSDDAELTRGGAQAGGLATRA